MQNHGPFTIGSSAKDAVKAAVMVEDVARTVHLAREAGPLIPIPQEAIDRLFDRYQNVYGQTTDARRASTGSTSASEQAGDARRVSSGSASTAGKAGAR
jgi:L-ribulose-5-phosphate 4-epimerase